MGKREDAVGLVREMIAAGRRAEAMQECRDQLENRPADTDTYLLKGLLLTLEDRPNDAVAAYETALSIAPDSLSAYMGIAEILAAKKWFHSAVVVMESALQAEPDSAEAKSILETLRDRLAKAANDAAQASEH